MDVIILNVIINLNGHISFKWKIEHDRMQYHKDQRHELYVQSVHNFYHMT